MSNAPIRYPFLSLREVNEPMFGAIEEAALRVIRSGYYIGGPEVKALEDKMCAITGADHTIGVSNGLDALRLIFRAYIEMGRLKPGDKVVVPADTYIASVLAVTDNGLVPVFADPNPATMNLDGDSLERALTPDTRAVLTVHLYGRVAIDEKMIRLVRERGLLLIEDAAQSIGARSAVGGLTAGKDSCGALGHATGFSFYPTKNVGALGDSGAVTTDDPELAETVRALANYGSDRRYHNIYRGLNCRLDPIQAAMISAKLDFMDDSNAKRRELATVYNEAITNPPVTKPVFEVDKPLQCVWHQYTIRVDERDRFREFLLERGVQTDVNYPVPVHKQPCYEEYSQLELPVAERIADTVVCLPISSITSPADAREIAKIINDFR